MVFCGKASQGCKNCRTRRIKCDKVRPECSQCIRLGKKCPGYRDQLSLMFRDESSKVMAKAHAQWGVEPGDSSLAGPSSLNSPSPASSSSASSSRTGSHSGAGSGTGSAPTPTSSTHSPDLGSESAFQLAQFTFPAKAVRAKQPSPELSLVRSPGPTWAEKGTQFYIDHYLMGYPDEPKTYAEVTDRDWLFHPSIQTIMGAVGLAGLSNIAGDEQMTAVARQNYVKALQDTAKSLANLKTLRLDVALRGVVMLAMFEVVKGTHETIGTAQAHIMGAAALIRSFMPVTSAPANGFRGLIQLCYSMLIPCLVANVTLPPSYFDWVSMGIQAMPKDERPATDLLPVITSFVHLSAHVNGTVLRDGQPSTARVIEQALQLDTAMAAWERGLGGKWLYTIHDAADLPPETCFHGKYHAYSDMWSARVWSHYRWARILVNEMILDFNDKYPQSIRAVLSASPQKRCLAEIRRHAEAVLTSIPTHWRHPKLSMEQRERVETLGGAGAGAAGVPATLFHLKVASCAPGVPYEYWEWSLAVLETVWADMGMLQAKSLAGLLRTHMDSRKVK